MKYWEFLFCDFNGRFYFTLYFVTFAIQKLFAFSLSFTLYPSFNLLPFTIVLLFSKLFYFNYPPQQSFRFYDHSFCLLLRTLGLLLLSVSSGLEKLKHIDPVLLLAMVGGCRVVSLARLSKQAYPQLQDLITRALNLRILLHHHYVPYSCYTRTLQPFRLLPPSLLAQAYPQTRQGIFATIYSLDWRG